MSAVSAHGARAAPAPAAPDATGPAARPETIAASDGFALAASVYEPDVGAARATVLILPATAVARGFYDRYARFLAGTGLRVVSVDYRGIGGSRPKRLRGFAATMRAWGEQDVVGAIAWIRRHFPESKLLVVGHSGGGYLLGLAPESREVAGMITVGTQSGYFRLWDRPQRYRMALMWYAVLPALSHLLGFFPSKLLGLGEDLPRGVALEWARWCRTPDFVVDARGAPLREHFAAFRAPIRSYGFDDDGYAPRRAIEALLECYENAPREHRQLAARDLGVKAIGHFGFFRPRVRDTLWRESADWLATR